MCRVSIGRTIGADAVQLVRCSQCGGPAPLTDLGPRCPTCGMTGAASTRQPTPRPPEPPPSGVAPGVQTAREELPPGRPSERNPYRSPTYRTAARPSRARGVSRRRQFTLGQFVTLWGLVGFILGGGAGFGVGVMCSQFAPLYGGWLVQIADPFSPARLSQLPGHAFLGTVLGGIVVGALAAAMGYLMLGGKSAD